MSDYELEELREQERIEILKETLKPLRTVTQEEIESKAVTLQKDEFLLQVNGDVGFMIEKLNKDGQIHKSFLEWGNPYWDRNDKEPSTLYILKEEYRSGWKFLGLRTGMSTAWIRLQHPLGFSVEINGAAFEAIADKITMDKGVITTPLYFKGAMKSAKILIKE